MRCATRISNSAGSDRERQAIHRPRSSPRHTADLIVLPSLAAVLGVLHPLLWAPFGILVVVASVALIRWTAPYVRPQRGPAMRCSSIPPLGPKCGS
jgi:hypothetical protein